MSEKWSNGSVRSGDPEEVSWGPKDKEALIPLTHCHLYREVLPDAYPPLPPTPRSHSLSVPLIIPALFWKSHEGRDWVCLVHH